MQVSVQPSELRGSIEVQGSKNAGQKIIPSLAAVSGVTYLHKCSLVGDNLALLDILESLGAHVSIAGNFVSVDTTSLISREISRQQTVRTTGSFIFAGALLGRFGHVRIGAPGGDEIGSRPVDFHLAAFEALGAKVVREGETYVLTLDSPMPADYTFPNKTANGTVNAVLLASFIPGVSVFRNVDWDPDIKDFCRFLSRAGAKVEYDTAAGAISVNGGSSPLAGCEYTMLADRNDAVTWLAAGLFRGGELAITNAPEGIDPAVALLREMGAKITDEEGVLTVRGSDRLENVPEVFTAAYPGLSTDWGPMLQAVMCTATGSTVFTECVFSDRFSQIDGFVAMGAKIEYLSEPLHADKYRFRKDPGNPHSVLITGPSQLRGTKVCGRDIRGAASLLIAGLGAESGTTTIDGAEHLLRGYENLVQRVRSIGGDISSIG